MTANDEITNGPYPGRRGEHFSIRDVRTTPDDCVDVGTMLQ